MVSKNTDLSLACSAHSKRWAVILIYHFTPYIRHFHIWPLGAKSRFFCGLLHFVRAAIYVHSTIWFLQRSGDRRWSHIRGRGLYCFIGSWPVFCITGLFSIIIKCFVFYYYAKPFSCGNQKAPEIFKQSEDKAIRMQGNLLPIYSGRSRREGVKIKNLLHHLRKLCV